jgi:hypothetical protein
MGLMFYFSCQRGSVWPITPAGDWFWLGDTWCRVLHAWRWVLSSPQDPSSHDGEDYWLGESIVGDFQVGRRCCICSHSIPYEAVWHRHIIWQKGKEGKGACHKVQVFQELFVFYPLMYSIWAEHLNAVLSCRHWRYYNGHCRLNIGPCKICTHPNPWNLWVWPYLGKGSLQM